MPTTTELLPLPGYDTSVGVDIDDKGRVVGYSGTSLPRLKATLWIDGTPIALDTSTRESIPTHINNSGDIIVIQFDTSTTDQDYFLAKASASPSPVALSSIFPGMSTVYGLNDKRQILGYVDPTGYVVRDLDGGPSIPVPDVTTGTHYTGFLGIDNHGRIACGLIVPKSAGNDLRWIQAGSTTWHKTGILCVGAHLTLDGYVVGTRIPSTPSGWADPFWCDLGASPPVANVIPPLVDMQPSGVNSWGANKFPHIVGGASNGADEVPFRYAPSGSLEDLSPYFAGLPAPIRAIDANDQGQILVQGRATDGTTHTRAWILEGLPPPPQRVQIRRPRGERTIDPLALLLPEDVYVRLNLPYPLPFPQFESLPGILRNLTPDQASSTLARLDLVQAYVGVIERELAGRKSVKS